MSAVLEAVHLTPRETEIARLMADGKTSEEMGIILGITAFTVDTHKRTMKLKLNVYKDTALVAAAFRHHIIE